MKNLYIIIVEFGFNPLKFIRAVTNIPYYFYSLFKFFFKNRSLFKIKSILPVLSDRNDFAGDSKGVYFKQDLIVSRKIFLKKPANHVDFGSRIDGFVSNIASFMDLDVSDIRSLESDFPQINFKKADLSNPNLKVDKKYDSVSSLHALEHFGLGRYGDPINPDGHLTGFKNIINHMSNNATLYFSVPIGKLSVAFNAHRIFSIEYLIAMFENHKLKCIEFDYIDDNGKIFMNQKLLDGFESNYGCNYGCGIFTLQKV